VLQSLTLMQKQAETPAVLRFARSAEREVRAWLYGAPATSDADFAAAVSAVVADVEDRFPVTVELVTVGTCPLHDRTQAVIGAIREALTNAAKHGDVCRVSLFAEVADASVLVLVRDRGRGFDPAAGSSPDRRGIPDSIEARMRQHGGTAAIRSTVGEGTEVGAANGGRVSGRIRVFVVDDHAVVRAGVRAEVGAAVEVVGEAGDVASAIEAIRALEPDVVLLDAHLPAGGGRAVLDAVLPTHPHVRFLALPVSDAAEDVRA
jgi:anti-sigma regulatory factor (Ser/Thr protein kinase)